MTLTDEQPAAGRTAPPLRWWREVVVILWLYFVYDMINNLSGASRDTAVQRARHLLSFEQHLHIDVEHPLNAWTVHHRVVATILGNFYNLAHIWVTLAVIVFVWFRRRAAYAELRNALVVFNAIGFVVFWVYPVAPPRMLDGYVDIVETTRSISSFHRGALAEAANQLAAMPSLHIAWAIWVAVVLVRTLRGVHWRLIAGVHLALTVVAVLATGNHFVLDMVAGALTAAVGFSGVEVWARRSRPRFARPLSPDQAVAQPAGSALDR